MMLSSRAAPGSTALPATSAIRAHQAPRGLLQRVLGGPNSFSEAEHRLLNNRIQVAHWPARTVSSTFLLSCAPNAASVITRWFARYRFGSAYLPAWTHSLEDSPRAARTESVLAGHRIQIAFLL